MARTKKSPRGPKTSAPSPSTPASRRPLNALFVLAFLGLSAIFTWLMRVETVLNDVPPNFQSVVESAAFENGTPLETRYTGVKPVDEAAAFLVAAFLAGSAGWDAGVKAQQAYFLMNWFAIVCIWSIEASRRRNAGRLISFVALFALLYQVIGAAVIAPLYYALYAFTSAGDEYYFQGREVPSGYARAVLPATVLGYLVPTVALYYVPWGDIKTVQYLTAFWQLSPLYASALLVLLSFFTPSSSSSAVAKNGDVKHLKRVYLVLGLVSAVSHISTLYFCLTSGNPQLSLSYVFLPNRASWKDSMALGLHYIFQIDFFGAFGATLFWCWLVVYDVLRILGKPGVGDLVKTVLGLTFSALVTGPGTTIAMVCSWREDRLVMIESGVKGTWKKPKAA
ncbi:hypothetical protein F4776DRAFT_675466 [Hypoxylon sp. NC0597]|nr:hypothetical protein F4776DRAFT_675466 [Hypoxylon sp. NC0597]